MGKLCLGVQMTCSVEHQLESKDLNLGLQDIKEEEEPGHQTGWFMHSFIHSFIPASFIHSRVYAEDKHRIRAMAGRGEMVAFEADVVPALKGLTVQLSACHPHPSWGKGESV